MEEGHLLVGFDVVLLCQALKLFPRQGIKPIQALGHHGVKPLINFVVKFGNYQICNISSTDRRLLDKSNAHTPNNDVR